MIQLICLLRFNWFVSSDSVDLCPKIQLIYLRRFNWFVSYMVISSAYIMNTLPICSSRSFMYSKNNSGLRMPSCLVRRSVYISSESSYLIFIYYFLINLVSLKPFGYWTSVTPRTQILFMRNSESKVSKSLDKQDESSTGNLCWTISLGINCMNCTLCFF